MRDDVQELYYMALNVNWVSKVYFMKDWNIFGAIRTEVYTISYIHDVYFIVRMSRCCAIFSADKKNHYCCMYSVDVFN